MNYSKVIMDLWNKYDLGTTETCRLLKVKKRNVQAIYMKRAMNFIAVHRENTVWYRVG